MSCIDVHAVYSRIAVYLSRRLPACTARELRLTRKIVNDANTPPIASLMEARIPPLTTVANGRRPGVSAPAFRIEQPGAMARANSQKRYLPDDIAYPRLRTFHHDRFPHNRRAIEPDPQSEASDRIR